MTRMGTNSAKIIFPDLSFEIMGAIFEVHKRLGPGFLESVYQKALIEELGARKIRIETQKPIDIIYKDKKVGVHRLDMVVEDKVVLELKTVERFCVHHTAQLTSYLQASGYKLGILVNFSRGKVEYRRVLIR